MKSKLTFICILILSSLNSMALPDHGVGAGTPNGGLDIISILIGLVIGLIIGYFVGTKMNKK